MNIAGLNTGRFISCLWAINLALTFAIIGNFVILLYRSVWYHHFLRTVLSFLVSLAFFVVYRWFPFNINSGSVQQAFKIVLILIMLGATVAGIIELVKFLKSFFIREPISIPLSAPVSTEISPQSQNGNFIPGSAPSERSAAEAGQPAILSDANLNPNGLPSSSAQPGLSSPNPANTNSPSGDTEKTDGEAKPKS